MSSLYTGDREKKSNWVIGRGGETCSVYCRWMGRQCDSKKQSELKTEEKINEAMISAGIDSWKTGRTLSDADSYEPPREVGPTFYHQLFCQFGHCFYKTEYTKFACYIRYGILEIRPLCYCR